MLRLGDLLDADNSRFEPTAELVTGELPQDSAGHKGKHEATVHLLITPEQIEYRADCPNHGVYRETRVFLDWLENELTFAAINWLNFIPKELSGTAPRLTKKELLLNGKPDIDNTSDLRFGISQEKAFEIIEGSGIYNDKLVFLRELIQNAEDASKIQLWRDLQKRPDLYLNEGADKDNLSHIQPYDLKSEAFDSYKITVDMEKEPDDTIRIRVIDRGTGMSVDTVQQMCKVGTSYHQDKARRREIEAMPAWLRPTAGFGIGLQSVFLVAPAFTIYSRTEEKAIKVMVESRKKEGYVQVEDDTWKEQGTCVEILLLYRMLLSYRMGSKSSAFFQSQYDPFSEENELPYYCLSDTIEYEVGNSLFPVVLTKDGNEWNRFAQLSFQDISEGPFYFEKYVFFKSSRGGLNVWDKDTFTLLNLSIANSAERVKKFKGKQVAKVPAGVSNYIKQTADFYGLDTKTYLSINREAFKRNKLKDIEKMTSALMCVAVNFLMKQDNISEWIVTQETAKELYSILDYNYILWQIADDEQKERMIQNSDKFIRPMVSKVHVLEWENDSYCLRERNVSDIILNTSRYIFCNDDVRFQFSGSGFVFKDDNLQKFIAQYNKISSRIKKRTIVLDSELRHSLPNKTIDKLWIDCDLDSICFFSLEITESYCCQVDQKTKNNLLKTLSENSKYTEVGMVFGRWPRRRTTPAFNGYKQLALPDVYAHTMNMWRNMSDTYYIISPFLADEPALNYSKDELISHICQTPEFNNLADYVLENRADPTPCTKEDIIETYKRLLSEYYDVMHEDETVKEESEGE